MHEQVSRAMPMAVSTDISTGTRRPPPQLPHTKQSAFASRTVPCTVMPGHSGDRAPCTGPLLQPCLPHSQLTPTKHSKCHQQCDV